MHVRGIEEVIEREAIDVVVQPIIRLVGGSVEGYEALARGPMGTELESPVALFAAATAAGLLPELDRICQRRALSLKATVLPPHVKLFLNVDPRAIAARPEVARRLWLQCEEERVNPQTVVLEVTEQATDTDAITEAVRTIRRVGFWVAVDDLGIGGSNLDRIVVWRPEVIKLDRIMIQGIAEDGYRAELVGAIAGWANKSGIFIVGEGIEEADQVEALRKLGVWAGQGYHLGRPGALTLPPGSSRG